MHALTVVFVDSANYKEAGIGNGGPSREFAYRFTRQLLGCEEYINSKSKSWKCACKILLYGQKKLIISFWGPAALHFRVPHLTFYSVE